ncbi:hypothetical protein [Rhizobium leguminosarum]|nr:hypothetical protein HB775_28585 [Rhizobium leguminosarum bv. trifolii]
MVEFDLATFLSGLLGSAITAAGVLYAARQLKLNGKQHESAEEWKRMEFASQLVERLSKDEELAFCARALDWGVGPLIIPEKYRVLFRSKEITIAHDWNKLARAVQPRLDPAGLDPELLVYRYCFDAFGGYLETIARHLELGTVKRDHLVGVGYFLSVLMNSEYYRMLPTSMKLPDVTEKMCSRGSSSRFIQRHFPC